MTSSPRGRGVISQTWMLSKALVVHRALAIRRDWKSRSLYSFALALGIGLFLTILLGTYSAVRVLEGAGAYGLLATLPAWAFLVYLLTDILIAFGQALGDLYLSRDMAILLAMPLRMQSIVIAKFLVGVAQNEVYAVVFLVPFALGFLFGVGAPAWTFFVAGAAVLVFPATLYAALVVVTIVAVRIIPPRAAKEGLWVIGASVPTIFWFLSFYRIAHIGGDIATMRLPAPSDILPSTWIGNALAMLASGDFEAAFAWLAVLFIVTFLLCPLALAVISSAFARGWSAAESSTARHAATDDISARRGTPADAIATKDWLTFRRSPQLWFNHVAALGFVAYLLVGHSIQSPLLPLTVQLAMLQIGLVAVLGAVNPGMTAFSLEHRAIWLLKAAPVLASDVVRAKTRVTLAQSGTIIALGAAALAVGYRFSIPEAAMLVAFGVGASACAVLSGMAFDAAHPSFDWENPNHINRGIRMLVPICVNVGMLCGCAVLLFGFRALLPGVPGLLAGWASCAGLQLAIASRMSRAALRDIAALDV